jgi:hypothetical protein
MRRPKKIRTPTRPSKRSGPVCDDGRMSPSPRRLTFAVGTSLLTASLATAACAKQPRVNTRPEQPPLEIVNEGPETPPEEQPAAEEPAAEEQPVETADAPQVEEPRTVNVRHADPK